MAVLASVLLPLGPLVRPVDAGTIATDFVYTGSAATYSVPAGTCGLRLELWGGRGQDPGSPIFDARGGSGGVVVGTVPVGGSALLQPGDDLQVFVGASGRNGGLGGAPGGAGNQRGGGATTVLLGDQVIAVAGGGGATPSWAAWSYLGGHGGPGGAIGTASDSAGLGGSASGSVDDLVGTVQPASGGSLDGPGAGATFVGGATVTPGNDGSATILGGGGAGFGDGGLSNSGGGGGGYYGGGGGLIGSYPLGGGGTHGFVTGGGGGSSFLLDEGLPDGSATSVSLGANGDGSASIKPLNCQTITFPEPAADDAVVGGSYQPPSSSDQGATVTTTVDPSSASTCQITAGKVHFKTVGRCVLRARAAVTVNLGPATASTTIVVGRAPQALDLSRTDLSSVTLGGTRAIVVTSNADVEPSFSLSSSTPGRCTVEQFVVSAIATGSCVLVVSASGTTNYSPASHTVAIQVVAPPPYGPTPQVLDLRNADLAGLPRGSQRQIVVSSDVIATPTVAASTLTPARCSVSGELVVTAMAVGTCTLSIHVDGTAQFAPAYTTVSIPITPGNPQLSSVCPQVDASSPTLGCLISLSGSAVTLGDLEVATPGPMAPAFTSSSDGSLTVRSLTPRVCSMKNGLLKTLGLGGCHLQATQEATSEFLAAGPVDSWLYVQAGYRDVSFPSKLRPGGRYQASFILTSCLSPSWATSCTKPVKAKALKPLAKQLVFWPFFLGSPAKLTLKGATLTVNFKVPRSLPPGFGAEAMISWWDKKLGVSQNQIGSTFFNVA